MVRFSVKYLDGIWRASNYTIFSKENEKEYANELAEMFKRFLHKGNILGYRVEIVTNGESEKSTEVISSEEM